MSIGTLQAQSPVQQINEDPQYYSHVEWQKFIRADMFAEAEAYLENHPQTFDETDILIRKMDFSYHLRRRKDFKAAISTLRKVQKELKWRIYEADSEAKRESLKVLLFADLANRAKCHLKKNDFLSAKAALGEISLFFRQLPERIVRPYLFRVEEVEIEMCIRKAQANATQRLSFLEQAIKHSDNALQACKAQDKRHFLGRTYEIGGDVRLKCAQSLSLSKWEFSTLPRDVQTFLSALPVGIREALSVSSEDVQSSQALPENVDEFLALPRDVQTFFSNFPRDLYELIAKSQECFTLARATYQRQFAPDHRYIVRANAKLTKLEGLGTLERLINLAHQATLPPRSE